MTVTEAIDILEKGLKCHAHYETGICPKITHCPECEFYCGNEDFYEAIAFTVKELKEVVI